MLTQKINAYFATLIVTIVGSGAALLIIHVANNGTPAFIAGSSEQSYANLQQSILQGSGN